MTTSGFGLDLTLFDTIGIFLGGALTILEDTVVVMTSVSGLEVTSGVSATSTSY